MTKKAAEMLENRLRWAGWPDVEWIWNSKTDVTLAVFVGVNEPTLLLFTAGDYDVWRLQRELRRGARAQEAAG